MNNSNDTIGNRTRDLPACSAVPQPNAPPCVPPVSENTVPNLDSGFVYLPSRRPDINRNLCNSQLSIHSQIYVYIPTNPAEIQTPAHRKMTVLSTTAPPSVLLPSSIFPQSSSHFCLHFGKGKPLNVSKL